MSVGVAPPWPTSLLMPVPLFPAGICLQQGPCVCGLQIHSQLSCHGAPAPARRAWPVVGVLGARGDVGWGGGGASEEPIFDLADFFVSADPIYCFKIQTLAFLIYI